MNAVSDLADKIGDVIEFWGFKNVHGRIWTHLYLSQDPLDSQDIRERLRISKALVSLSIRDLLKYGLIEELGESSRGTLLYSAIEDPTQAMIKVLRERELVMVERALNALQELTTQSETHKVRPERVLKLQLMTQMVHQILESLTQNESAITKFLKTD